MKIILQSIQRSLMAINPLDQGFLPVYGHPIACLQALNQAVHVNLDRFDLLTPRLSAASSLLIQRACSLTNHSKELTYIHNQ